MNILSMISTDEWEAMILEPMYDHGRAETAELIRIPLAGWAHTDDPYRPVVGLRVVQPEVTTPGSLKF